jgi:hypothetical protein
MVMDIYSVLRTGWSLVSGEFLTRKINGVIRGMLRSSFRRAITPIAVNFFPLYMTPVAADDNRPALDSELDAAATRPLASTHRSLDYLLKAAVPPTTRDLDLLEREVRLARQRGDGNALGLAQTLLQRPHIAALENHPVYGSFIRGIQQHCKSSMPETRAPRPQ